MFKADTINGDTNNKLPVGFRSGLFVGDLQVLMRRKTELVDLSLSFLWAVAALLVYLGGTREHILALFIKFFTRTDLEANFKHV